MADSPRPKRTGTIHRYQPPKTGEDQGHYVVRCSAPDGSRPLFHLDPGPENAKAREAALATAAEISEKLYRDGIKVPPKRRSKSDKTERSQADTLEAREWWDRFFDVRDAKGMYSMRGNYQKHIRPEFDVSFAAATARDAERLRDALDAKAEGGEIAPKTAFNVWTCFRTASKAAAGTWNAGDKRRTLKVRGDDIADAIVPPDYDPKEARQLQWLYPREVLAVAGCPEVRVEVRRRIVLATYLCLRGGELEALSWSKVDLERGVVTVDQAWSQEQDKAKKTKTGNRGIRRFAVAPEVIPLLKTMHALSGGAGRVIGMPRRHRWVPELHAALKTAGVTRAELFETTDTSQCIRFHDLKATGLTWMAIRGDTSVQIQHVAAHTDFKMTQRYLDSAREASLLDDERVFPPLPEPLLCRGRDSGLDLSQNLPQVTQVVENMWVDRDLNPGRRNDYGALSRYDRTSVTSRSDEQRQTATNGSAPVSEPVTAPSAATVSDPVEQALAKALELAAQAAQWHVVEVLARELSERRRSSRASSVTSLDDERAKRRGD